MSGEVRQASYQGRGKAARIFSALAPRADGGQACEAPQGAQALPRPVVLWRVRHATGEALPRKRAWRQVQEARGPAFKRGRQNGKSPEPLAGSGLCAGEGRVTYFGGRGVATLTVGSTTTTTRRLAKRVSLSTSSATLAACAAARLLEPLGGASLSPSP